MRQILIASIFLAQSILLLVAPARLWAADAAGPMTYSIQSGSSGGRATGTEMKLLVYKTGLYRGKVHTFLFPEFSGELTYDAEHPEASRIALTIRTGSFELTDDWLSEGDREDVIAEARDKVLEVARYPEMRFASSSIQSQSGDRYQVQGELKIRDRAEPVTVEVMLAPGANGVLQFTGTSVVKLTDYGIKPPSKFFGIVGTKDEMDFAFRLTAARPD